MISPEGKLLKIIPVGEDPMSNNAFGGPDMKTLYVTAGKTLYKLQNDIAGLPRQAGTPRGSRGRRRALDRVPMRRPVAARFRTEPRGPSIFPSCSSAFVLSAWRGFPSGSAGCTECRTAS